MAYVLDTFTGTDGTTLASHNCDTGQSYSGASGAYQLSSNKCIGNGSNDSGSGSGGAVFVNCLDSDGTFSVDCILPSSGLFQQGLVFRCQNSTNYLVVVLDNAVNHLGLYKVVSNTFTSLFLLTQSYSYNETYTIKVVASGSIIQVYLNGSLVFSVTSTQFLTNTNVGLFYSSDIADEGTYSLPTFDNLSASPVPASYAPEIVTGPPIPGAPWKSTYVEPINSIKESEFETINDTLTITQSATASVQLHGAPRQETIGGPPIYGAPWKSFYTEQRVPLNHSHYSRTLSDTISVTQTVIETVVRAESLFNTITITDSVVLNTILERSFSDKLIITQQMGYTPLIYSISDNVIVSDVVVTSGLISNQIVIDTISVSDTVNRVLTTQSVSDTITITDSASRLSAPVDSINVTDRVSFTLVKQGTPNPPVYAPEIRTGPPIHGAPWRSLYVEPVTFSTVVNRQSVSSTVTVTDSVNYFVASQMSSSGTPTKPVVTVNGVTCRQDKSFAPNGNPPYTAPTIVTRTSIILTYPYDMPSVTLTLRNPEFNNQYKRTIERIIRNTRNNKLLTFRDPQWPLFTRLNYTIRLLKQTDAQNMLLFFTQSLGQQIGLLDFESRQWQGVILNPQAAMEFVNRPRIKSFQIEFEGNLV